MVMIERDLAAASDLFALIKYTQNSIDIAKTDAPNLLITYATPPFKGEDGKTYEQVSTHGALGVEQDELRIVVVDAIQKHLESKIEAYRATLAKLGVKLEEPMVPASKAIKADKPKKKHKRLAAPKKQLRLVAPTVGEKPAT